MKSIKREKKNKNCQIIISNKNNKKFISHLGFKSNIEFFEVNKNNNR